ncbi:MAG: hypothetical protein ACI9LM_000788 [Alteromonadaceae bacterium]|jgi:hypothetical protein
MLLSVKNILRVALLLTAVFQSPSYASEISGKLEYFSIEGETVFFKTDSTLSYAKSTCVTNENTGVYTIALNNAVGRAMYAALVSASTGNKPVKTKLSGACNDIEGYESITSFSVNDLNIAEVETPIQATTTPSLKLVGRGFTHYNDDYQCQITITLHNASGQAYAYNSGGNCACRNSKASSINLVNPSNTRDGGLGGRGRQISCYIEE